MADITTKSKLEAAVLGANKARAEGKGVYEAEAVMHKLCEQANKELKDAVFAELLADTVENPMLAALTKGFMLQYRLNEKSMGNGSTSKEWEVVDRDVLIPLKELIAATTRHIVVKDSWPIIVETVTGRLVAKATLDTGGNMDDFKTMYKAHQDAKAGINIKDPLSVESLTTDMKDLLSAICPSWAKNLTKYDANFILYTCFGRGKGAAGIRMPKEKTFLEQLQRVAYVRIHGMGYTQDYKIMSADELKAELAKKQKAEKSPEEIAAAAKAKADKEAEKARKAAEKAAKAAAAKAAAEPVSA